MVVLERKVTRDIYFGDFSGPYWPDFRKLEHYFLDPTGDGWPREGGNDNWGLGAEGLDGTDALSNKDDQVSVNLTMTGHPGLGVRISYARWDGRTKEKLDYESKGDWSRVKEIVYSLQGDPTSVGSLVPFADAYRVLKEFIETDGELPTCIEWTKGAPIPPEAFAPHLYRSGG
jgi:hypothetical protein